MFLNYLKLALRLLVRNPFFSFINVLSLSLGIVVFFVLYQYADLHLNADRFHKDFDRIFRFGVTWKWTDDFQNWNQSNFGINLPEIAAQVANDFSEITDFVRVFNQENFTRVQIPAHGKEIFLTYVDQYDERNSFVEMHGAYADPNLFEFFTLPLLNGDPKHVLNEVNAVVLSERTAQKYFGRTDVIGKILLLNDTIPLKVTGVFKSLPANTHLQFEFVISSMGIRNSINQIVMSIGGGPHCYYKLKKDVDVFALERSINEANKRKYWQEIIKVNKRNQADLFLQPLADMVFNRHRLDHYVGASRFLLQAFVMISVLVLVMAWINYINLTIASNSRRVKEIIARNSVGAKSRDLVKQFVCEAFVINAIAVLVAYTFLQIVRKPLEVLFGFDIPDLSQISVAVLGIILGGIIIGILITGIYPALITLRKTPGAFYGNRKSYQATRSAPGILATIQFIIASVMIIWTFSVYQQINYVLNKDIGINKHAIAVVELPIRRGEDFESRLSSFERIIGGNALINGYTISYSMPAEAGDNSSNIVFGRTIGAANRGGFDSNGGVDEHFIPFYGIKLIAGRNFLSDYPADKESIILSLEAIKRLGIKTPYDAIGKIIEVNNTQVYADKEWKKAEIIGVVEDYEQRSFLINKSLGMRHFGIALTYKNYLLPSEIPKKAAIRIDHKDISETLRSLENEYKNIFDASIFNWFVFDALLNSQYKMEQIARNQLMLFTILSIGIACLGLLAMITSKAMEKTKEIGIRKVLGARLYQIGQVLLNTTFRQIIIAGVVGIPVAWYLTQLYLEKFSEQVRLHWWDYMSPLFILVVLMLSSIASVLWKTARSNPVEALKHE